MDMVLYVLSGLISVFLFKIQKWETLGSFLWLVSIFCLVFKFRTGEKPQVNFRNLGLIFVLSLIVFGWRLTSFPGGVWTDEVETSLAGVNLIDQMVSEKRFIPFSPEATGHPALSLVLNGLSVKLLGNSVISLRLPAILATALSVVVFYLLLSETIGYKASSWAIATYASSYWILSLGRIGYDAAYFWLIFNLILWQLVIYWKYQKLNNLVWLACFLGFGLYTYLAFRTLALGIIMIIMVVVFMRNRNRAIVGLTLFGYVFGLIVSPLFFYHRRNPGVVFARADDVSLFNRKFDGLNRGKMIEDNLLKSLEMFIYRPDPNIRHNIAQRPVINLIELILVIIGLFWALNQKKVKELGVIGLLAGISVANGIFTYEPPYIIQPHSLRMLGLLPLTYLLVAMGISLLQKRKVLMISLVLLSALFNLSSYFGAKIDKKTNEAFQFEQTRTALLVQKNCKEKLVILRKNASLPHLEYFANDCQYEIEP